MSWSCANPQEQCYHKQLGYTKCGEYKQQHTKEISYTRALPPNGCFPTFLGELACSQFDHCAYYRQVYSSHCVDISEISSRHTCSSYLCIVQHRLNHGRLVTSSKNISVFGSLDVTLFCICRPPKYESMYTNRPRNSVGHHLSVKWTNIDCDQGVPNHFKDKVKDPPLHLHHLFWKNAMNWYKSKFQNKAMIKVYLHEFQNTRKLLAATIVIIIHSNKVHKICQKLNLFEIG